VTPYLDDKRNRVAYSLRARAMRAPVAGTRGWEGGVRAVRNVAEPPWGM
jgi:hypothetical protein